MKDTRLRQALLLFSLIVLTLLTYVGHCWLYGDLGLPLRLVFMGLTLAYWVPAVVMLCMIEMDPVE